MTPEQEYFKLTKFAGEMAEALKAALEWIDAVPDDVAARLPAMPGFDRDWVDGILADWEDQDFSDYEESKSAHGTMRKFLIEEAKKR